MNLFIETYAKPKKRTWATSEQLLTRHFVKVWRKRDIRQIKKADKISAWLEAVQLAGFTLDEANKFFGAPDEAVIGGLTLHLRPPVEARAAYIARHNSLLAQL